MVLGDYANIATIVLAVATVILVGAAIIAGIIAYKNINVLREQRRIETLLKLIERISSQHERDNRAALHGMWINPPLGDKQEGPEADKSNQIVKLISHVHELERKQGAARTVAEKRMYREKAAVEETISSFDTIGFFLLGDPPKLEVDSKLRDEAPSWIWEITQEMWDILGDYVVGVQSGKLTRYAGEQARDRPNYGKYFLTLKNEADSQLPNG